MDFSWFPSPFWCCTIQLSFLYHFPWHFCISREVSAWESTKHQPPTKSLLRRLEESHFTWLCLSPGITLTHRGHLELWEPALLSDSSKPGRHTWAHRYTYSLFDDRGWMCMDVHVHEDRTDTIHSLSRNHWLTTKCLFTITAGMIWTQTKSLHVSLSQLVLPFHWPLSPIFPP